MARRPDLSMLTLLLLPMLLYGCPKKVEILPPERPPYEDPILKLLKSFSPVESLQARTTIRIETVRDGEELNFLLNGFLLYQKPDHLRLLGFHPLGMGLFDALYRNGELFLLIPPQRKAYIGEVARLEEVMAKIGEIRVSTEKSEGGEIPYRIQIEVAEKETRIELRLRGISTNIPLPQEAFWWELPEGVEVRSMERLLRGLRKR